MVMKIIKTMMIIKNHDINDNSTNKNDKHPYNDNGNKDHTKTIIRKKSIQLINLFD